MLHKLYTLFVVVPLGLLLVVFAVANRHAVTVSLDPFGSESPALATAMPLFILIFLVLLLGVLAGGAAMWINQGKWRREVRRLGGQARALRIERDALKAQIAERDALRAQAAEREAAVAAARAASAAPAGPMLPAGRDVAALPAPLQPA